MKKNMYSAARETKNSYKGPQILFKPLIFVKNANYLYVTPYKVSHLKINI